MARGEGFECVIDLGRGLLGGFLLLHGTLWVEVRLAFFRSPVQMLRSNMMFAYPLPAPWMAETSGAHTARKWGRSPPMSHFKKTWKTAAVMTE